MGIDETAGQIQRAFCRFTCAAHGEDVVAVIEDDAGNSGGDVVEVGELALRAMQGAAVRVLQVGRAATRAVA